MNTVSRVFSRTWRTLAVTLSLAIVSYVLYFHRLSNLLPGYSASEMVNHDFSVHLHSIFHNPVNAPYTLPVWLLSHFGYHSWLAGRIVAASYGIVAVILFFMVIRHWHGLRTAYLATVMFATSAGLLHAARTATPQILQMGLLAIIAMGLWYRRQKNRRGVFAVYACMAVLAVLLYVPGMIWFELLGLFLLRRGILTQLRSSKLLHVSALSLLFLVLIAPLIVAILRNTQIALDILGLPHSLGSLRTIGHELSNTVLSIGIRSNGNASLWVGHMPLLNAAELVFGLWGAYRYIRLERTVRSAFIAGAGMFGILLISLRGFVTFTLLVPLAYICIASGIDSFLAQWLRVFPRNPIARTTGTVLISLVVAFSSLYQLRSYFVAWPHAAATRALYSRVQPR